MRIYDPRVGRFLSVDPLMRSYPWYTPYQFAGNSPIVFVDLDGKEAAKPISGHAKTVLIVPDTAGTAGYTFNSAYNAAIKNPKIDVIKVNDVGHLSQELQKINKKYNNLIIADHSGVSRQSTAAGTGGQRIGYYNYNKSNTVKFGDDFEEIGKSVKKDGHIILLGCMLAAPQYLGNDYLTTVAKETARKVYGDQGETFIGPRLFESQPLGRAPAQSDNQAYYYPIALANAGKWTLATPEGKTKEVGNLKLDDAGNPSTIPVQTQTSTSATNSDAKNEKKTSTPPPSN